MQHRSFPRVPELPVSRLGFGCMRLPTVAGDPARVDEGAAVALVRQAIEAGVSYVETAETYRGGGADRALGRALAGGWRDRIALAAQVPMARIEVEGDWERRLDEQLERLGTNRVDFYLFPALTLARWARAEQLGAVAALERARADGRVRHVGFSHQGSLEQLEEILDAYGWELCQLPLNFADADQQVGVEGLLLARARRIGVVLEAPLRGGELARPPPVVREAWDGAPRGWSLAEWALRWAWAQPAVVTVLTSMTTSAEVREDADAASRDEPFVEADARRIEAVRRVYRTRRRVPCEGCGGCLVCANQLPVSEIFSLYNDAMFVARAEAATEYRRAYLEADRGADRCVDCGACEPMCPHQIPIPERLREAHAFLAGR